MKVLVLGAGGMAGHVISLRLSELGHSVTGLARKQLSFCKTIIADARDIEKAVDVCEYDAVVNSIGLLVKACDDNPAEAVWINSYLPRLLAKLTAAEKTRIIHLSTDCVFSGHGDGRYDEKSFPNASYMYGRSKALGELIDDKNLTFRMSIVGPDINVEGTGLFNWFMQQNESVGGYTGAIWTGVTTLTLADAIHAALEQNLTGLYHLVNNETISKLDLLKLFNTLRSKPVQIVPNSAVRENRSLINTRYDFDFTVPGYDKMVGEIGEWIVRFINNYTNYNVR